MTEYELVRNDKDFSENMLHFKQQEKYCDVVVIVNEERIPLHSAVLAANSDYFQEQLSTSPGEIVLSNVDTEATKMIIEYCYTGKLKLHPKDLSSIITTAELLKIKSILDACGKILETTIDRQNFFYIWTLAGKLHLEDQEETAFTYVIENFKEISKSEDILQLDIKRLTKILKSISGSCLETEVFDLIKRWVNHDRESRSSNLVTLLGEVQLENLPHGTLISESQTMCQLDPQCFSIIMGAMSKQTKDDANGLSERNSDKFIVIGGFSLGESNVIETYDIKSNNWDRRNMEIDKINFASVYYNGRVYVIGGYYEEGYNELTDMESYDKTTWTKTNHSPMNVARYGFGAILLEGFIYVVGGKYGRKEIHQNNAERYDINKNSWTLLEPMPTARYYHGMAAVDNNIFVIGGRNTNERLGTNECYSVDTGKWRTLAPLQDIRSDPGVAFLNGFIYAVGGKNDKSVYLSSVERYDVALDKWIYVQALSSPLLGARALSFCGSIIVTGGENAESKLTLTQKYDPLENKWMALKSMNVGRNTHNFLKISN